jgi:hypothetical protein
MHDCHAGLIITGLDSGLYAGSPSVARQQRGMRIDTGYAGHIYHLLRKNLPVSHNHHNIRLPRAKVFDSGGISHALRLVNGDSGLLGANLHTRGGELLVATDRAVRLGNKPYQFTGCQQ